MPVLLAGLLLAAAPAGSTVREPRNPEPVTSDPGAPRASATRKGVVTTEEGLKLRVFVDLGSVRIFTLQPGEASVVRYTVHIETDAAGPLADQVLTQFSLSAKSTASGVQITGALPSQTGRARGSEAQFWVHYDVAVPRNYNVEVTTGAGDIETVDINGTAALSTQGGNIRCGRIAGVGMRNVSAGTAVARLETQGGHITVKDVAGDLDASTGGGHITAGIIAGDAKLHSGGGHIRAAQIGGRADLSTDGGNITVGQVASTVAVHTGGGQIDFGEVRGSVHAQTGGGGIRITYVAGPMEVETSSGSICLTRVAGSVRAATAGGTITAFISPDTPSQGGALRLAGASELSSRVGDIIVFLPRNLAVTIDAAVESGGLERIQSDPSLPLKIQVDGPYGGGAIRANGALNGGGATLRLRTAMGKIRLQYLDSDVALRTSLMQEQMERITRRLQEVQMQHSVVSLASSRQGETPEAPSAEKSGWLGDWLETIEERVRGGVGEDPEELQKRAVYSPPPPYPVLAMKAGIQGTVRLQVRIGRDGRAEVLKILQGEPVLAEAAIAAVKQWRYKPRRISGRPVHVISEVTFTFQLH
jgi:TonB family protein